MNHDKISIIFFFIKVDPDINQEENLEPPIDLYNELDIGLWPSNMDNQLNFWFQEESEKLQNCDENILNLHSIVQNDNTKKRICKSSLFFRKMKNGELIKRSWLCFSPSTGKLYCFYCKLFYSSDSSFSKAGYSDWKNAYTRLGNHELSEIHCNSVYLFTLRFLKLIY